MPVNFLPELIFIIIAAFIGGFVARSIKLPPVLGYIASGIVFGVLGKNFFHSYDTLVELSQMGISLLLFTMGFEISLETFKKVHKKVFVIGILQVLLTMIGLLPVFLLFNFDTSTSIFFAYITSFSSTVVIVKVLEGKGLLHNFPGTHVFIYLLLQDLFVVPIIFLLPLIFSQNGLSSADIIHFLFIALKPLIIFIFLYSFSKLFLSKFLNLLFKYPSHELNTLATIFIAALSIGLLESVGLPQSIAAFLAGVLISEQGKNLGPLAEIRPLRDILLVLFFVTTGMLLQFNFVLSHIGIILLLAFCILVVKYSIIFLLLMTGNYFPSASVFISSNLTNIGEFAIVVAQIALVSNFITDNSYNILLSVFIISVLLIPLWITYAKAFQEKIIHTWLFSFLLKNHPERFKTIQFNNMKNHVIICGHGRVGQQVRALLDLAEIPYAVIDFDKKAVSDLTHLNKFALYGDPTDDEILKAANVQYAKVLVIAIPEIASQKKITELARHMNHNIIIICRSHREESKADLMNLGVTSVIVPEFEAGLKIGDLVLENLDIDRTKTSSFIKHIRKQHSVQ